MEINLNLLTKVYKHVIIIIYDRERIDYNMNNAMLSIYSNKIKKFYDKGFSKEEVKNELEQEKNYYENALFEVNERKQMIEDLSNLKELYNEDTLGFNGDFKSFEEFKEHMGEDSLKTLKESCIESEDYHVCDFYGNPKDIMCTRWEVEQRIYAIEHHLLNFNFSS